MSMIHFNKGYQMQVDSTNNQQNVAAPVAADPGVAQGAPAPVQPATFDTSAAGSAPSQESGSAGSPQIISGPPPAGQNVGTEWKMNPDGKDQYVGYFPVPKQPSTDSHVDNQWDVFKRGFTDGATHPGQTMGKIADIANGETSHSGEQSGAKVDNVLEKLPVVGDALNLTRGLAGEKDSDGNPLVPYPNVQPDATEFLSTPSANRFPVSAGSEKPLMAKPEMAPTSPKTSVATGEGVRGAPGAAAESPAVRANTAGATRVSEVPQATVTPVDQARVSEAPQATVTRVDQAPPTDAAQSKEVTQTAPSASGTRFGAPEQYAGKPNGNLQANPSEPGVYSDTKGQAYIQADNQNWPVRYDKDNATWRAYSPTDASKPQYPVRLDEQGNWQVHNDVGLKGGNPGDKAAGGKEQSNRDRLGAATQSTSSGNTPGSYPSSVKTVNDFLQRAGVNLSNQSADTIMNNLKQVNSGEIAHAQASAREAWTFARDVADPNLSMKDRSAAALGAVVNGIVAPAYMAQFDLDNYHFGRDQSADLRRAMQRFVQNDPHS
jgi:hypothetical protein